MKRKIIVTLLALIAALCLGLCLTGSSCNTGENESSKTPDTEQGGNTGNDNPDTPGGNTPTPSKPTSELSYTLLDDKSGYKVSGIVAYSDTEIVIPSTYNGKPVVSISMGAFYGCSSLTSIAIPDSVTSIGSSAFGGCSGLTSVTIPDSVTYIGSSAFYNCSSLVYNEYDNAKYLGNDNNPYVALIEAKNTSVTSCTINENTNVIASWAFKDCSSLTSVTIPDSVTSIGNSAFDGCDKLTSITIPDSVTSIGSSAFGGCSSLVCNEYDNAKYLGNSNNPYFILIEVKDETITSCTINKNTKVIAYSAFSGCSGLKSVTIPDSVTSIGSNAFDSCRGLTSIYYTGDISGWCGISGLNYLMSSSLTLYIDNKEITEDLVIPDGVTSISKNAFEGCSGLTSVTIPDSVTFIGDEAFWNCPIETATIPAIAAKAIKNSALQTVVITSGETISDYAFDGCSGLTSITIPDSVTSIGSDAFRGCTGLTSVTIPDSVTSISNYAFSGCTGLTSVTIPDSVTYIGSYAFEGCSSLVYNEYDNAKYLGNGNNHYVALIKATYITSCTINENTNVIASWAFKDCSSLTSVTIPDSVTSIGDYAFYDCSGLTSVTIPDSVTSIGGGAFSGCSGLTSVTIPDSVTSIGGGAFAYCSSLVYNEYDNAYYLGNSTNPYVALIEAKDTSVTSCTINENTKCIAEYAFYFCSNLTNITISDSVTSIGSCAFGGCLSLTSVTIPDSVTSIGIEAFNYCSGLTSVNFKGTMAQWNAVEKSYGWNYDTGDYTVQCTDGKFNKNGNEIG